MGRNCGFLALNSAIASGAEAAIIPEISIEKDQLGELIEQGFRKSKSSSMVLVTESEVTGGAIRLAERVKKRISTIRCTCFHSRASAARRITLRTGSNPGQSHGYCSYTGFNRESKERDDGNT